MSDFDSKPGSLGRLGTYTLSEESESDEDDTPTVSKPGHSTVEIHDIAVAEASPAEAKSSPSQLMDPEPTSATVEEQKTEEEDMFNIESGSNVQEMGGAAKDDVVPQQMDDESYNVKPPSQGPAVDDNENSELLNISENSDLSSQELHIPEVAQSPEGAGSPKYVDQFENSMQHSQGLEFQNFQQQSPQTYQSAGEDSRSPLQRDSHGASPVRLRTPGRSSSSMSNSDNLQFQSSPQTYQSPMNPNARFDNFDETSQSFDYIKTPGTYQSPENPITPRALDNFEGTSQHFDYSATPENYQSPINPISRTETPDESSQGFLNPKSPATYDNQGDSFSPLVLAGPDLSFLNNGPAAFQPDVNYDANFQLDDQEDGSQHLDVSKSFESFQLQEQMEDAQHLEIPESTSENLDIGMSPGAVQNQENHNENFGFFESTSQNLDVPKSPEAKSPEAFQKVEDPEAVEQAGCAESTSEDLGVSQVSEAAEETIEETMAEPTMENNDEKMVEDTIEKMEEDNAEKMVEEDPEKMEVDEGISLDLGNQKSPKNHTSPTAPTSDVPSTIQAEIPLDLETSKTPDASQTSESLPVDEPMETEEAVAADVEKPKTPVVAQSSEDVLAVENVDISEEPSPYAEGIKTPETYQSPEAAEVVPEVDSPEEKTESQDAPKNVETESTTVGSEDKAASPEQKSKDLEATKNPSDQSHDKSPSPPPKPQSPEKSPTPEKIETLEVPPKETPEPETQEAIETEVAKEPEEIQAAVSEKLPASSEEKPATPKEPETVTTETLATETPEPTAFTTEKPSSPAEKEEESTIQAALPKTPETYQSPQRSPEAEKPTSPEKLPEAEKTASPEKSESPQSSESSRNSEDHDSPSAMKLPSPPVVEAAKEEEKIEPPVVPEKRKAPAKVRRISSDSDSSGSEDEAMDTDEKKVESKNGKKKAAPLNVPWKSPRQEPVDGIVQPRTEPPKGKPTRHTNCLDHLLFTVVKEALKHKHSWPFQDPVDALSLNIPEYHKTITRPMDLRTIEKRLRNTYYWSYLDAVKDIKQMFDNCYKFNPPEYDVYKMAKTLESQMMGQVARLPTEVEIDFPENQRRLTFPRANGPGKAPKTPKTRGRKSARGRKKVSLPRSASAMNESGDDPYDADDKDEEEEAELVLSKEAVPEPKEEETQKLTLAAPPAKKRKVENGTTTTPIKVTPPVPVPVVAATPTPSTPVIVPPVAPAPSTPAPPSTPRKNPNSLIDWKSLTPRWQGKPAEWQKFCTRLLNEIHSVKNKSFAQIFYVPVDPIKLKIADYLDVIKNPMDLQTMKKKLDHKQYAEPEEFVHDMNLMIDNCCLYNPKGSVVYQNALDLKSLFEQRWKLFPRPGVDPIVSDSYINQNLVVNTDLIEDERINSYLAAVKAEETLVSQKLDQLRAMSDGLYKIATARRDARLSGSTAPVLGQNQMAELEQLGISIKNTPVMIPELISPALSVRSSSRAPVPKIIDDIGPSPTKARKISKPRASVASNASTALYTTPAPSARGRKPKKSGRPMKRAHYSPAHISPNQTTVKQSITDSYPYKSIYGRKTVLNSEFNNLGPRLERAASASIETFKGLIRLIQLGQRVNKKRVATLKSLCREEVNFSDLPMNLYVEFMDYLTMMETHNDEAVVTARARLEALAAAYGFTPYDDADGYVPREAISNAAKQLEGYSSSPSASRTGAGSSDSDSGSESEAESSDSDDDSEPERKKAPPALPKPVPASQQPAHRAIERSAGSSRASTPVAQVSASRPPKKESLSPSDKSYQKRVLSEESSSSDSSSDSSDSETETKGKKQEQHVKTQAKPNEVKKTELSKKSAVHRQGPPPPKKKPQLTILDDLLPEESDVKKPMLAAPPMTSRPVARAPSYDQKPTMTEEQKHAEALRLRAEARRRREQEEPFNHQAEVMAEFEFNNY